MLIQANHMVNFTFCRFEFPAKWCDPLECEANIRHKFELRPDITTDFNKISTLILHYRYQLEFHLVQSKSKTAEGYIIRIIIILTIAPTSPGFPCKKSHK